MLSPTLKRAIMDHMFRDASWAKPTEHFIGLFTTLPNAAGTGGVEPAVTGYERVEVDVDDDAWDQDVDGVITNAAVITFADPDVGNPWGVVVGFGLWDAITAGNLTQWWPLSSNPTINDSDPGPRFPIGTIQISIP